MSENIASSLQYLTFVVEHRVFAFEVLETLEVLSYIEPTPIPDVPDYVVGLVNVRGTALLVVDLRKKFGIAPKPPTEESAIIVIEQYWDADRSVTGVLVDAVKGVIRIEKSMIEKPPRMGDGTAISHISGVGKVSGEFIIILKAKQVVALHELSLPGELFPNKENTRTVLG